MTPRLSCLHERCRRCKIFAPIRDLEKWKSTLASGKLAPVAQPLQIVTEIQPIHAIMFIARSTIVPLAGCCPNLRDVEIDDCEQSTVTVRLALTKIVRPHQHRLS